jgi:hypothetical protein
MLLARRRGPAARRVHRAGEDGPGTAAGPGAVQGPRYRRSQPGPDRGRRLQRRADAAGDAVPAAGARAQPGTHRSVLRSAGGRGVRVVRPGQQARPVPWATALAGHRPVHRAADRH